MILTQKKLYNMENGRYKIKTITTELKLGCYSVTTGLFWYLEGLSSVISASQRELVHKRLSSKKIR